MTKIDKIKEQIKKLQRCLIEDMSIAELEKDLGVYVGYFYDVYRRKVLKYTLRGEIPQSLAEEYLELYKKCGYRGKLMNNPHSVSSLLYPLKIYNPTTPKVEKNTTKKDISPSSGSISRSTVKKLQNNIPQIEEYVTNITINGTQQFFTFSREDMETIHKLYSKEGKDLSQKAVLRQFPNLSRQSLKKILTAFNITKDCAPFAPHELEEKTNEELHEQTMKLREQSYFNKLDAEKTKILEKRNYELKSTIENLKSKHQFMSSLDFSNIKPFTPKHNPINTRKSLFLYISDCHVGAFVDNRSIYSNNYDKSEFNNRLDKIVTQVKNLSSNYNFDKIIICNLGDSLDGYYGKTTRGGHNMPQNMDNKEQFEVFTKGMIRFFDSLNNLGISNTVDYLCVGEDNHSGDFGWAANATLEAYLKAKYPSMHIQIFKKFIGVYNYGKHTFILTHGKDATDMFKNLPLTLNDKAENFLSGYIDSLQDVRECVHVIKGDLHQSSTNFCNKFRYKNVGSLFGSSKWIHHNFGNTKACIDFDIIESTSDVVISGRMELN